jgi:hypothetical protein
VKEGFRCPFLSPWPPDKLGAPRPPMSWRRCFSPGAASPGPAEASFNYFWAGPSAGPFFVETGEGCSGRRIGPRSQANVRRPLRPQLLARQVRSALAGGAPGTIDDLKALMLDILEIVQNYTRNADTDGWEAYWNGSQPKVENICRDRVLDALRPRVDKQIDLLPESLMPEKNRVDILALHTGKGLPIEVKGQWHADVWDASKTQLDDKYGRDWRADGRGIYLVLWFGPVPGKALQPNPEGLTAPSSPQALRTMLTDRLSPNERARIDIFVLDVSKPPPKKP